MLLEGALLLGAVRIVHQLQQSVSGGAEGSAPPRKSLMGKEVPPFVVQAVNGSPVSADSLSSSIVLFVSPTCPSCMATLGDLHYLSHKSEELVVVCFGDQRECAEAIAAYPDGFRTIVDHDGALSRLLEVDSFPEAVMIDRFNRIAQYGNPTQVDELEAMMIQNAEGAVKHEHELS